MAGRSLRPAAVLLALGAVAAVACNQSALLGVGQRQVQVSAASGGTIAAAADDAPELAGFSLVLHPGDLPYDTPVTLRLGSAGEELGSAGPSVQLGPAGLQLLQPAELALPYSLGPGQFEAELFLELEDGTGPAQRIEHPLLVFDSAPPRVRCPLPRLGEVHALAPVHCDEDAQCGSAGYCHEPQGVCRPLTLSDGGLDPEADGGSHHP
jgi:hypothetical protein